MNLILKKYHVRMEEAVLCITCEVRIHAVYHILSVCSDLYLIADLSFKDFRNYASQRNWAIVFNAIFVSFFMDGNYICCFPLIGYKTSTESNVKNDYKRRRYRVSAVF